MPSLELIFAKPKKEDKLDKFMTYTQIHNVLIFIFKSFNLKEGKNKVLFFLTKIILKKV